MIRNSATIRIPKKTVIVALFPLSDSSFIIKGYMSATPNSSNIAAINEKTEYLINALL
ncbi:hypothetical protein IKQ21_07175 [bacterium]|nr:hypothetical protein [bacterium]